MTVKLNSLHASCAAVLLACAALITPCATGYQSASGGIRGTAVDEQGAVMPNVSVTLYCDCKECKSLPCDQCCPEGFTRSTTSDQNGDFSFHDVPEGVYAVRGEATGFAKVSVRGVKVHLGAAQVVTLTFGPDPAALLSQVTVSKGRAAKPGQEKEQSKETQRNGSDTSTATINVKVVDVNNGNAPVEGAKVTFRLKCDCKDCSDLPCDQCCPQNRVITAITDKSGFVQLEALRGEYTGEVTVGAYSKNVNEVKINKDNQKVMVAIAREKKAGGID